MTTVTDTASRRSVVPDSLVIAVISVLGVVVGINGMWSAMRMLDAPISPLWSLALAGIGCVVLLAKRRYPLAVTIVTIVMWLLDVGLTGGGLGSLIVVTDALWTASYRGPDSRRRSLLIILVVVMVLLSVTIFIRMPGPAGVLSLLLSIGAVFGTVFWAATAIARARELAQLHERARAEDAEKAEHERQEALRREREQMARELHDLVGGHLSATALRAEAALLTERDASRDADALRAVRESSLQAHDALRSMIGLLRSGDTAIVAPDLFVAIPAIVADAERTGFTVNASLADPTGWNRAVEQTTVRVIREGITNAIRHAADPTIAVDVSEQEGAIEVSVISGGIRRHAQGFVGNGWGIDLLRERVTGLGGTLSAGPDGDGQWVLRATLPQGRS